MKVEKRFSDWHKKYLRLSWAINVAGICRIALCGIKNPGICRVCGKDLNPAIEILGNDAIALHRNGHLYEAEVMIQSALGRLDVRNRRRLHRIILGMLKEQAGECKLTYRMEAADGLDR